MDNLQDWAIKGIDAEIKDREEQLAALRAQRDQLLGPATRPAEDARNQQRPAPAPVAAAAPNGRVGRRLSDEARKRLSESMRQRWAQRRAEPGKPKGKR
jgi:hypothetical protein